MNTDLQTLKDTFRISYRVYESSREEANEVTDLYHNRQYTDTTLDILGARGQPAETYNVIKFFVRALLGNYSLVTNTVKILPVQENDIDTAHLLHDIVQYTFRSNHFETESDKIKLDGLLHGLMCTYIDVVDSGKRDMFDRPINRIRLSHVPSREILLDPTSVAEDYSDARYIHRFKWVSEDALKNIIRTNDSKLSVENILKQLIPYENITTEPDAEFTVYYPNQFVGEGKVYNNYQVIHSIITDDDNKVWSIMWSGNVIISKKEVTYRDVKFPYRIQRLHTSNKAEYYGLFREVIETQKAINQALLRIQLLANTQKIFVQEGAVSNMKKFTEDVNRINSVVPVKNLRNILIQQNNADINNQYVIIEKAYQRVQLLLGVNDSWLGRAFAADSGRKVKIQQNAATVALRYVTTKIEECYRVIGEDIINLVKQFYLATDAMRITEEITGERWIQINQPKIIETGQVDEQGNPIYDFEYAEVVDPENHEPMKNDEGEYLLAPVPTEETEIAFSDVDVIIDTKSYDDEDEANQMFLNTILQGPSGQALLQIDPAAYFSIFSLSVKNMKVRHSPAIASILEQVGQKMNMMQQQQQQQQQQEQQEQQEQQQMQGPQQ